MGRAERPPPAIVSLTPCLAGLPRHARSHREALGFRVGAATATTGATAVERRLACTGTFPGMMSWSIRRACSSRRCLCPFSWGRRCTARRPKPPCSQMSGQCRPSHGSMLYPAMAAQTACGAHRRRAWCKWRTAQVNRTARLLPSRPPKLVCILLLLLQASDGRAAGVGMFHPPSTPPR